MAHELGHALGLADAYPNANGGKTLKDNAEIENGETGTIMWDNGTVSSNDIEMVLEAFKTNKEPYYMNYKGHKKSGVIRVKQKFKK